MENNQKPVAKVRWYLRYKKEGKWYSVCNANHSVMYFNTLLELATYFKGRTENTACPIEPMREIYY